MLDRIPTPGQEGRVLVTPENGAPFYAKIKMADNPTQEGHSFSKETMLKDDTASLYGLGADGVPDDVFAMFVQHWWKRREVKHEDLVKQSQSATTVTLGRRGNNTIYYSDSVEVVDGAVSLVNPSSVGVGYDNWNGNMVTPLLGKYITNASEGDNTSSFNNTVVYYVPPGSSYGPNGNGSYVYLNGVYLCTAEHVTTYGEWEILKADSRDTYPDSGEHDGYEYTYLGAPLKNTLEATKIATGSYTGTGTDGSSNPNTLTFSFEPKMVFISEKSFNSYGINFLCVGGCRNGLQLGSGNNNHENIVTWEGTTMSWYCNTSNYGMWQMNRSGEEYIYFAIG